MAFYYHHHHCQELLLLVVNVADADQEVEWRRDLINILSQVPQSVRVVMRYLFAFLNQYVSRSFIHPPALHCITSLCLCIKL